MTELVNTKQRHHLRLLERFVVYDPERGLILWREWPEGAIVTDPEQIELLTAQGAPVERVDATGLSEHGSRSGV